MTRVGYFDVGKAQLSVDVQLGDEFILVARARVTRISEDQVDVTGADGDETIAGGEQEADLLIYRILLEKLA